MREINAINTKNYSRHNWNKFISDLPVCEAISLQTKCIKFCLNVHGKRKVIVFQMSRMSGLDPGFRFKMTEVKVAKVNTPLN